MFAIIGEVVIYIRKIWKTLSKIKYIGRVIKGIACTLQWYAWLQLILGAIELLGSLGIPEEKIAEMLGISGLFNGGKNIKEKIKASLAQASETVKEAQLIDARLQMQPSGLNGVHRPPYHSIAIQEVLYEFAPVLGYGTMVIMHNPEGFNFKPKDPTIVRYVDEQEFSNFINSKSWGEYWRVNYLLGRSKRNKQKAKQFRAKSRDVTTGDFTTQPQTESMSDYIERVLDLPDYADTTVAGEFQEMIIDAFEKQEKTVAAMTRAIEKGSIGRGVEENGLRVTNLLNEKARAVPAELKRIIATNPIFKDVAKVLPNYKRSLARIRNLKSRFISADNLSKISTEAAALAPGLGLIGTVQTQLGIATNFGVQIGTDLTIESTRAGAVAGAEYAEAAGLIKEAQIGVNESIDSFLKEIASGNVPDGDVLSKETFKILEKLGISDIEIGNSLDTWTSGGAPKIEELGEILKNGLGEEISKYGINWKDVVGEGLKGLYKVPTCVPFIKG